MPALGKRHLAKIVHAVENNLAGDSARRQISAFGFGMPEFEM
jgi:hypothetical protein